MDMIVNESEFVRVFDVRVKEGIRASRLSERLKDEVENIEGLLCFLGDTNSNLPEIELVRELAPNLIILVIDPNYSEFVGNFEEVFIWKTALTELINDFNNLLDNAFSDSILMLREAGNVDIAPNLLEDVSRRWTVLSSNYVQPPNNLTQEDFDEFLNGDENWGSFSYGVPYNRASATFITNSEGSDSTINFLDYVYEKAKALEVSRPGPHESLEQILMFTEPGSGATTILRQAAMFLAKEGFPTIISKPAVRDLNFGSLENFILNIQDTWKNKRPKKSHIIGLIPVCVFVDTDVEFRSGDLSLPAILQSLGRKIILVRALQRSSDEIQRATGIITLTAEVKTDEIVGIGAHLRSICDRNNLETLPTDAQWRAFHKGVSHLDQYKENHERWGIKPQPSLFLIGMYPFIKERVADENSLTQYYFQKWASIGDKDVQKVIEILAVSATHGLSVPFDTLNRHPELDLMQMARLDKLSKRLLDIFVIWQRRGHDTGDWHLSIKHAAIGLLLSRAIDSSEGDMPYKALLPLLERLSTKEEDLWFAQSLAYRLGQNFKKRSPGFSLETDTLVQRSSRAIFNAIPNLVKSHSRSIRHHQGRYHIHVLRSCNEALINPVRTSLDQSEVLEIANAEFERATKYLNLAVEAHDESEPLSYIYNTFATAYFTLAESLKSIDSSRYSSIVDEALEFEDRAIKFDPGNGHALFQIVNSILDVLASNSATVERKLELLPVVELRLSELMRLHSEDRWRNIDPIQADIQLGSTSQKYTESVKELTGLISEQNFQAKFPEASIILNIRFLIGNSDLDNAFRADENTVRQLRGFREELEHIERSVRSDAYLYRLYAADPEGRLKFRRRLDLLHQIKNRDSEQFFAYWHDEIALHCQLDELDIGSDKFTELRNFRQNNMSQWFWLQERALLDDFGRPRKMTLEVVNELTGWARVLNSSVKIKYQPFHFRGLRKREVFLSYIRFTLNGLQAVPEELINQDLAAMGLK
jgi:hypothetical protein